MDAIFPIIRASLSKIGFSVYFRKDYALSKIMSLQDRIDRTMNMRLALFCSGYYSTNFFRCSSYFSLSLFSHS